MSKVLGHKNIWKSLGSCLSIVLLLWLESIYIWHKVTFAHFRDASFHLSHPCGQVFKQGDAKISFWSTHNTPGSRSFQHLCNLEGYKIMSIFPVLSSKSLTLFNNEQFSGNVHFYSLKITKVSNTSKFLLFHFLGCSLFDLLFDWICHEQWMCGQRHWSMSFISPVRSLHGKL